MNDRLLKLREEMENTHTRRLNMLHQYGRDFDRVLREFDKIDIKALTFDGTSLSLDISVTGNRHVLEAAWRALRRAGFDRPVTGPPKKGESTWSGFFTHPGGARVFLSFSSTTCHRVLMGYETKQVPIYETVCDEQTPTGEIT